MDNILSASQDQQANSEGGHVWADNQRLIDENSQLRDEVAKLTHDSLHAKNDKERVNDLNKCYVVQLRLLSDQLKELKELKELKQLQVLQKEMERLQRTQRNDFEVKQDYVIAISLLKSEAIDDNKIKNDLMNEVIYLKKINKDLEAQLKEKVAPRPLVINVIGGYGLMQHSDIEMRELQNSRPEDQNQNQNNLDNVNAEIVAQENVLQTRTRDITSIAIYKREAVSVPGEMATNLLEESPYIN